MKCGRKSGVVAHEGGRKRGVLLYCFPYHVILTYLLVFGVELYQMLSENLNRLHLLATHHPPISLFLPKNITNLLGMILLLETRAEKGLLIYV